MNTHRSTKHLAALALLAVLAACGGGDASIPAPSANDREVPAAAGQSTTAFITYLGELTSTADETREGLSLGNFSAPSSEVDEPIILGA